MIAPLAAAAGRCVQTLANHASMPIILAPLMGAGDRPRQCFNANGDPKVRHKSREDAIQHKRSLLMAGHGEPSSLQVYECNVCGYWHVGNRRRGGRR
jgi:hypothetical protein